MTDFRVLVSQEIWYVLKEASIFLLSAVLVPAGAGRPLAVR